MTPNRTIVLHGRRTPAVGAILTALYAGAAIVGTALGTTAATRGAALLAALACAARLVLTGRRRRRSNGPREAGSSGADRNGRQVRQ